MLGLLHAHWIVNRRLTLQLTPLWALYLWLGYRSLHQGAAEGMLPMISMVIASIFIAMIVLQGMNTPVEAFLLPLPVRRREVVSATYAATLLGGALGSALPLVTLTILGCGPLIPSGTIGAVALLFSVQALAVFIFLPLRFRLGTVWALNTCMGLVVVTTVVHYLWRGKQDGLLATTYLAERGAYLLDHPVRVGLPALAVLIALGVLSHTLACRIYAKRTF